MCFPKNFEEVLRTPVLQNVDRLRYFYLLPGFKILANSLKNTCKGFHFCSNTAGYRIFRAWCKSGTRILGPGNPGTRDPSQSLKLEPRTSLKFESGTPGPPPKFKSGTLGSPSNFKNGTLIIIFLHCLTYFVRDKYMYNMEIVFHE